MSDRRSLDFRQLDEIMSEVNRLLQGHRTSGGWTFGQILSHLARAIRLTTRQPGTSGPLPEPTPEQAAARDALFAKRSITEGRDLPSPLLAPDLDADPIIAAEALRKAIERLATFEGNVPSHPVLGPLTTEQWQQFHCIHAAHHLSFAHPT